MTHLFTPREYLNMVFCYGIAEGNATQALREYAIRYPEAHQPSDARVITRAVYRILDNQPIVPAPQGCGKEIPDETQHAILAVADENPKLGVRTLARMLREGHGNRSRHVVSYSTVYKTLRNNRQKCKRPNESQKNVQPSSDD